MNRRTSLALGEVMARRLHAALLADPVGTLDQIGTHGACVGLHSVTVKAIVTRLVATGRISQDANGTIVIAPLPGEMPA